MTVVTKLTDLGVTALRDGVAQGDFTAVEVAEAFNSAVADAGELNAFILATPRSRAGSRAGRRCRPRRRQAALPRWPVSPIGMKDLFCTRGVQSAAASHILEGFVPP